MRLHRFYIPGKDLNMLFEKGEVFLLDNKELEHQLLHVFRYKAGDEVVLFDGRGLDYVGEIVMDKKSVLIKLKESKNLPGNIFEKEGKKVKLFMSVIKKEHFEMVVEKVTELGVAEIVPIRTERSQKINLNYERLRKISIEATEQSGQASPTIIREEVVPVLQALNNFSGVKVIFHVSGVAFHTKDFTAKLVDEKHIGIFIGPEGGWSDEEVKLFKIKNIEIVHLNVPVLRAETAAIVGCYSVVSVMNNA